MTVLVKLERFFMNTPTIRTLLINELPQGFVSNLIERLPTVYKESFLAVTNDTSLGEEQAKYVMGYLRRGYAETLLERSGAEHGLKIETIQPENGGCKHIRVGSGRFSLAMCHVYTRAGFPALSDNRAQASSINAFLSQSTLFPIENQPKKEQIFGILVHTENPGKKDELGSVHIGFPNHNFDSWIEAPIDLLEIRDLQSKTQNDQENLKKSNQASPKLKKSIIETKIERSS